MIKTVFIDWFGTLSESRFFEHWDAEGHPYHPAFEAFQAWWIDPRSHTFLDAWLTGGCDVEAFLDLMTERLMIPRPFLVAELHASFASWTLLEPETDHLLAKLRARGITVVLATENVDACIRWALPALGLGASFDAILSSHELRARKHETDTSGRNRFFSTYLEANAIGPGESVLIDDSAHLASAMADCGIGFLHAPDRSGPGAHLRQLLAEIDRRATFDV